MEELKPFENIQQAFFFIPDISGFTKFVNQTKLLKSKHIIKELLEAILDSITINLKIYEIQGDAIVFYRIGIPPDLREIESQVKKTFTDFQNTLQKLSVKENSAPLSELSLKIIVHYGEVSTIEIKGKAKLLGCDVILAIRILKNDTHENEYLLLTDKYLRTQPEESLKNFFTWTSMHEGVTNYDNFGPISFKYFLLSALKN